jgi:beta-N-acetylhexosaminidase
MMTAMLAAVENGELDPARIDESARRIIAMKERFGLLDWEPLDPATAAERVAAAEGPAVLDDLFRAGVTIARDSGDHLPLRPEQRVAIVFLATRYQIQHECSSYRDDIRWVGVGDSPSDDEIGWARDAANAADVTVVFTQNVDENPRQAALVNALPPERTVVVALFSPYDWLQFPGISSYVATYSPLRPAVPAACAALFGAIPAPGRLPITLDPELPAGHGGF